MERVTSTRHPNLTGGEGGAYYGEIKRAIVKDMFVLIHIGRSLQLKNQ